MTKTQKPTAADNASEKHIEYFWDIICKVQEVQKALSIQELVLDNLKDMLSDLPEEKSDVWSALEAMIKATPKMSDKLGDVENITSLLCSDLTDEENILFSVMLDDMRMYADTGRL